MIEMTKIEGGLNYNGESRFFSYEYFELGFEVVDTIEVNEPQVEEQISELEK
jgi:hypothetical protein